MSLNGNTFHVTHLATTLGVGGAIKLSSGIPDMAEGTAIMEKNLANISETAKAHPFLTEHFPELVANGDIVIVSGHIYLYGISFIDILTGGLAVLSFGILLLRNGISIAIKIREYLAKNKTK